MKYHEVDMLLDLAEAGFWTEAAEIQRDGDHGEVNRAGPHPTEAASDTLQREIAIGILAEIQDVLVEIGHARRRLAGRAYGNCETCGQAIDADRLRAVPWARRCIADEAIHELLGRHAPSAQPARIWYEVALDSDGNTQGSLWDPEDDHSVDATDEAAFHETRN